MERLLDNVPEQIRDWDEFFLTMCELVARKSKDPSTKTGCVVADPDKRIRSMGFNGFPQGVDDSPARYLDRELKYALIAHCDANAVFSAARAGISLKGCTMFLTGPPCSECTKSIIQAGIVEVVWPKDNPFEEPGRRERWAVSLDRAEMMATESGVKFRRWERV